MGFVSINKNTTGLVIEQTMSTVRAPGLSPVRVARCTDCHNLFGTFKYFLASCAVFCSFLFLFLFLFLLVLFCSICRFPFSFVLTVLLRLTVSDYLFCILGLF